MGTSHLLALPVFVIIATLGAVACVTNQEAEEAKPAATAEQGEAKKKKRSKVVKRFEDDVWADGIGGAWFHVNEKLTWKEAESRCAAIAKKTSKRWRLPSPEELLEAKRLGISSSKNRIFGYVYLGNTWTMDWEISFDSKVGVYVDMNTSKEYRTDMDKKFTTVCVRTDTLASNDEWIDQGAGVIWRYVPGKRDWSAAESYCRRLAEAEKLPWRLSSREELTHAVESGIQSHANKAFGREYLTQTWSMEVDPKFPNEAYAVDLRDQRQFLFHKDHRLSTVCVRPLAH